MLLGDDAGASLKGFPIEDGKATLLTDERAIDLLVALGGYQPREAHSVASDTTVLLHPYPSVKIRLAGGVAHLPAGVRIRLSLQPLRPAGLDGRSYVTVRGTGSLRQLTHPGRTSRFVDASGEVTVRSASAGEYIVQAFLHAADGHRFCEITDVLPRQVRVRAGQAQHVFSIRIPPRALAKAFEKLRSDRK